MKLGGNERSCFLKELKAMHEDGYSGDEIIRLLNTKYGVDYKESTFKSLWKESNRDLFTKRLKVEEEYMAHCRHEYETEQEEENEAELLYKVFKGIEE